MNLLQKLHVFGFDLHQVELDTNIICTRDNTSDWLIYITHDYCSVFNAIKERFEELPLLFIFLVEDEEFTSEELKELNDNDFNNSVMKDNGSDNVCEFCVPKSWIDN